MAWPLSVLGHLVIDVTGGLSACCSDVWMSDQHLLDSFWLGRQGSDGFVMFYGLPHTLPLSFQWFAVPAAVCYHF